MTFSSAPKERGDLINGVEHRALRIGVAGEHRLHGLTSFPRPSASLLTFKPLLSIAAVSCSPMRSVAFFTRILPRADG